MNSALICVSCFGERNGNTFPKYEETQYFHQIWDDCTWLALVFMFLTWNNICFQLWFLSTLWSFITPRYKGGNAQTEEWEKHFALSSKPKKESCLVQKCTANTNKMFIVWHCILVSSVWGCISVLTHVNRAKFEGSLVSAMVVFWFILNHLLNVKMKKIKAWQTRQNRSQHFKKKDYRMKKYCMLNVCLVLCISLIQT